MKSIYSFGFPLVFLLVACGGEIRSYEVSKDVPAGYVPGTHVLSLCDPGDVCIGGDGEGVELDDRRGQKCYVGDVPTTCVALCVGASEK